MISRFLLAAAFVVAGLGVSAQNTQPTTAVPKVQPAKVKSKATVSFVDFTQDSLPQPKSKSDAPALPISSTTKPVEKSTTKPLEKSTTKPLEKSKAVLTSVVASNGGKAVVNPDSIYDNDPQQRLPRGMVKPIPGRMLPIANTNTLETKAYPPNWFTGMTNRTVQLMVHGNEVAELSADLSYPGVEIMNVTRLENDNYLFIDLLIGVDCKPGKFDIVLTSKGSGAKKLQRKVTIPYELSQKPDGPNVAQGVDATDFVYLLMPDRFSNGDPDNDSHTNLSQQGINRSKMYFRHGGDIAGMINHLDYLEDLGVTAVWPNPVLENDQPYESYHGYAVTDHYNIDRRFGSNASYKAFVDSCHNRGMKVVMDVITNHVGDQHFFIKDLPSTDWVHQWDTLTKPNYREQSFLNAYANEFDKKRMLDGWFDNHMPDLNQKNPYLAKFIIQNAIWWTAYSGHDAYRIDTYIYADQDFMNDYVAALRTEYPKLLCFGESWVQNPVNQAAMLKGAKFGSQRSELESMFDFQTHFAIHESLTKPMDWTGGVMRLYMTLAQDFLYEHPERLVTFLDNHDMSRFYSVVGEDMRKYKSGLAWLMTTRGIPQMYYGTEILMKNYSAPDGLVREDFPGGWKADSTNKFVTEGRSFAEQEAFNYVRTLAKYRKKSTALQSGKTVQFIPVDGVYVYFRQDAASTVMVVMNTDNRSRKLEMHRYAEMTRGFTKARDIVTGSMISLPMLDVPAQTTYVLELIK
jgi:neopullulanase